MYFYLKKKKAIKGKPKVKVPNNSTLKIVLGFRESTGTNVQHLVASQSVIFFFKYDWNKSVTSIKTLTEINMQIMVPV